jgi:NAD(P)-dependent dehydrogenase (short-subunit alcohol dehydrogenase family)
VIGAVDRDENTARDYDIAGGRKLVTLKLVGYTEVIHTLLPRMDEDSSIVLFGGLAKDRPYPGSTTVSTVNGGIMGMVHTLGVELAPIRVNAIHPAVVGDTPYWQAKPEGVLDALKDRTPLGRLIATEDVVHATAFLLENRAVTGCNLDVDGGWLLA